MSSASRHGNSWSFGHELIVCIYYYKQSIFDLKLIFNLSLVLVPAPRSWIQCKGWLLGGQAYTTCGTVVSTEWDTLQI